MAGRRVVWSKKLPEVYGKFDEVDALVGRHLDLTLLELLKLRSSILNGCAFCVDLHTRRALDAGETHQRLFQVSTWHEAGAVFTDAERAVLALTDEMTRMGEGGVSDATYDAVAGHFSEEQVAALMTAVAMINLYNRLAVTSGLHPRRR
ncbi:alkylhydroperoxidase [Nocardiopsis sp. CNR-923]|uniref:carboxymuconolactone decarboxylase family protein n=1 Tax=Nocardiopsis sp. CNR-923 TaxID=1904965 RepID=UPI0009686E75|nr:carboxymuconolactone decarboxylase family protein [Nocardiopsis sp. CNR-923]OLT24961.1 alkylhydroperoxidase [Nocardiopsis sp. CNR-923]